MKRWFLLVVMMLSIGVVHAQQTDDTLDDFQWDGTTRYTVLIMGMDRRPVEGSTLSFRTDTILIASIDPLNNRAGVLHIPRDMHFGVPGIGTLVPINTFMVRGENQQKGYGPELTSQILQNDLGIYIDAYILFDFDAFISVIDALGGIEIELTYNISDSTYPSMNYGYDPFYLSRGTHVLDGETALKFARTRHADNDYLRGQRQLQVVQAVRERLADPIVLQKMLAQGPALWEQMSDNIYSNIKPEDALYLGISLMNIKSDNIAYGALNQEYSYWFNTAQGQVRIPDREKLAELMTDVFGENYWQG